ncbi:hypothetical protein P7G96_09075 [Enterococcus thailandicus]|uniref:hypothetical protein n=1 Tax=Enterococcus TaxID=1350 RepID=UPI0022E810D0|nr:hypothetical protein [Enterococcus thailandicus]MDT2753099.1 hypothetical protein [Enterococcus thailandicus]MDT2776645.1 hypothetical protein [Enterococcus thailandicus]
MSELKKELEQDKDFVEEVSNRIYSDTNDLDEYMPEPEWIDRMTDIADKYITRFELAQKLVDKQLSSKHLQLNDNQKIVLDILKDIQTKWPHFHPSTTVGMMVEQQNEYFEELTKNQELKVYKVFIDWALEQEE